MLSNEAKEELIHQKYRFVGDHSAVKVCHWTKSMITGNGSCYKHTFYGIESSQCMQMTTSISCANRCIYCWRGYKAPVSKEWIWKTDDPELILNQSQKEHHKLVVGLKGHKHVDMKIFKMSNNVRHVALSLTGESIVYPRINELIDLFHKNMISTFLVTNAMYPEQIRNLKPITQLYISLDSPNKELAKKVGVPLFSDYWDRLNTSLGYMSQKKGRTCIRITSIKDINMIEPEGYAELIKKGDADFIEVKAYMHIGASRLRLKRENMPLHEEIVEFAKQIMEYLPDYNIVSEHIASRVVLFAKKKFKKDDGWHTWIEFEKFFEGNTSTDDYLAKTPITGLSGRGTKDYRKKEEIEMAEED